MDTSREQSKIRITLQTCLDAGAEPEQLSQIIGLFRKQWMDDPEMRFFIDDMEVRYIISMSPRNTRSHQTNTRDSA